MPLGFGSHCAKRGFGLWFAGGHTPERVSRNAQNITLKSSRVEKRQIILCSNPHARAFYADFGASTTGDPSEPKLFNDLVR